MRTHTSLEKKIDWRNHQCLTVITCAVCLYIYWSDKLSALLKLRRDSVRVCNQLFASLLLSTWPQHRWLVSSRYLLVPTFHLIFSKHFFHVSIPCTEDMFMRTTCRITNWDQPILSVVMTTTRSSLIQRAFLPMMIWTHTLFKIIIDTHINEFLEKKQERLGHSSTPSFSPSWTTELQFGFAQITYIGLIEVIVCVYARIVYGHTHTRSSYALLSRDGKIPLEIIASLHHFLREIILYISYWRVEGQVIFSDSQLVVGRHKTLCERNTRW